MADQNITELPVKTSSGITSSDYMLGIDSAEGYQMLIRDLGDYIIRNVQVNTIAGANQTLKSALDTLNSKSLTAWSSDHVVTDFNLVKTPGSYYCNMNAVSNGPSGNWQSTHGAELLVYYRGISARVIQVLYIYNGDDEPYEFVRMQTGESSWGSWFKESVRTEVDTLNSNTVKGQTSQLPNITTLSDLNSLSAGVHDRYIAGISGIVNGWYGIIVSTTNNVDAIPTQILYGTNGTYVRHSDDKITWSNSQVAVPSKLLTKEATTTATIHLPSNGRYVIFEMCNGANSLYATMVTVYSSGAVYKLDLAKGSEVSAELSTNTLTITSTPNVSFRILVMSLEPSISMDSITIS